MPTRRTGLMILILVLLILLAAAGGLFLLYQREALVMRSPVLVQEAPYITYISGEAYYLDNKTGEWLEPEVGQKLKAGSTLKTEEDGELDIRITSQTLLRMDMDTVMTLEKSTLKNLEVKIDEGRLYGRFHKLFNNQNFQVKTEEIVAGIRGTELVFEAAPGETTVYALSGITEIYNPSFPDDRLLLAFQTKTEVLKDQPPSQPEAMEPEKIREFQKTLNAIHSEMVLLVTRAIRFKPNSAEILESSEPELQRLFEQIDRTKYTIQISGHTADVGSANAQYNLSVKRAEAIKNYLVTRGVNEKRLIVAGYGGSRPVADNKTEEGRARNRRVEFIIID